MIGQVWQSCLVSGISFINLVVALLVQLYLHLGRESRRLKAYEIKWDHSVPVSAKTLFKENAGKQKAYKDGRDKSLP